ncbi:hypothetical protein GGU10DRAFT_383817 [Lentinula aff. detonsa]|uniref:Uncharacterized protein n=1 Tax=Lentinula aff. detonsa TaxID=2804958 RepID=A0AA38NRI0_9AGAR|nr:hypothetical protein GGU10DRAFT_383817 [Lentinula aff. detonsa]
MKFGSSFVLLASAIAVCAAPVEEVRAIANHESFTTYYGRSVEGSVVESAIAERDAADPDNFFSRYYTKAFERVKGAFADNVIVAARAVADPDEIFARYYERVVN